MFSWPGKVPGARRRAVSKSLPIKCLASAKLSAVSWFQEAARTDGNLIVPAAWQACDSDSRLQPYVLLCYGQCLSTDHTVYSVAVFNLGGLQLTLEGS